MKRHGAPLVVFSGIDGAGKSTQIERLRAYLNRRGVPNVTCWSRGGYTPLFELAKRVLRRVPGNALPASGHSERRDHAFRSGWVRRLWLTIGILDLAVLYGARIRWWRLRGKLVICDRYLSDTRIDFRLNFPDERVDSWWSWRLLARVSPRPDLGFLLLIPVEECLQRSRRKEEPFPDSPERIEARLACYRRVEGAPGWSVLDGLRPASELSDAIVGALEDLESGGADAH